MMRAIKNSKDILAYSLFLFFNFSIAYSQTNNFACLSKDTISALEKAINPIFVKSSPFILLGITHKVDVNQGLYTKMIQSFHRRLGIRYIICEGNHGETYLINRFLETGEERYLEYEYEWSEEMRRGFRNLYEYNKGLEEKYKIVFIGVDALLNVDPLVFSLQEMMPSSKPPEKIAHFVDSIKSIILPLQYGKNLTERQAKTYTERCLTFLKNEVSSNFKYYQEFLGEKFPHLLMIIDNDASMLSTAKRDIEMYKSINRAQKLFGIKTGIFGMFGSAHTSLKQNWTLASNLRDKEESPYYKNTYNINVHYENSYYYFRKAIPIDESLLDRVYGKRSDAKEIELKKRTGCENFILEVNKENLPLNEWCDYLIYVTGGKALQSLRNQK